jgi:hypothetical protein
MATFGQREDLYSVTVILVGTDGQKVKFTFDAMDGGGATAKETKYRPGNGTIDEETLGGANSISNITVKVKMTYAMYQWVPWMITQNGKATMYVNKQPLDLNGAAFGKPLAYKGGLTAVDPPKTDSMSDAVGMLSLTQSTVTPVTTG